MWYVEIDVLTQFSYISDYVFTSLTLAREFCDKTLYEADRFNMPVIMCEAELEAYLQQTTLPDNDPSNLKNVWAFEVEDRVSTNVEPIFVANPAWLDRVRGMLHKGIPDWAIRSNCYTVINTQEALETAVESVWEQGLNQHAAEQCYYVLQHEKCFGNLDKMKRARARFLDVEFIPSGFPGR